jgi:hypothetical protein
MNYVSLIFPPRDNRGQNNEQSECFAPPTDIYSFEALHFELMIPKHQQINV